MNIKAFYIHGYESAGLSEEKQEGLRSLGIHPVAPVYNYSEEADIFNKISRQIEKENPAFLIGSSMGGRLAFYLGNTLQLPCLLFNPALVHQQLDRYHPVPATYTKAPLHPAKMLVMGERDKTVPARSTVTFLAEQYPAHGLSIKFRPELEHRIPSAVLKEETAEFLASLTR